MRIVSCNCSNTEIVWALGCADQLVGVDDHSDWPPEVVAGLPRVGRDLDIDVEKVAALQPDLVLASNTVPGHERVLADLQAAGLPFYGPETITLEDVYTDIRHIAGLLGVPERGERLVEQMHAEMEAVPAPPNRPSVLVHWWMKPVISPGGQSWVTEMVELAGGRNPLATLPVKSIPMTDEEMARLDPDVVVVSWCGMAPERYRPERVTGNPMWRDVTAVREGRVVCIPEAYLGRPGPRLVNGYRQLRRVIESAATR